MKNQIVIYSKAIFVSGFFIMIFGMFLMVNVEAFRFLFGVKKKG